MPLQFIYSETCHYNSSSTRSLPFSMSSECLGPLSHRICVRSFHMDKNTLVAPLVDVWDTSASSSSSSHPPPHNRRSRPCLPDGALPCCHWWPAYASPEMPPATSPPISPTHFLPIQISGRVVLAAAPPSPPAPGTAPSCGGGGFSFNRGHSFSSPTRVVSAVTGRPCRPHACPGWRLARRDRSPSSTYERH